MKIYLVSGTHPYVPGVSQSVHFDEDKAVAAVSELLSIIAADIGSSVPPPEAPSAWQDHMRQLQRERIESEGGETEDLDDEDLFDLSGFEVGIVVHEVPTPRIVVSLDGGLVEGIASDIEIDAYVVDYDVEGGDSKEILEIPQGDGEDSENTAEAFMRGEEAKIEPRWIDRALVAYRAHDLHEADADEHNEVEA